MFLVVAINQGLFPVSHIQVTSRCAGAGREHGQTDSQAVRWKYSIPWRSWTVSERWLARRQEAIGFLIFHEFQYSLGREFKHFRAANWL